MRSHAAYRRGCDSFAKTVQVSVCYMRLLRHCATRRDVPGSIPGEVLEILQ